MNTLPAEVDWTFCRNAQGIEEATQRVIEFQRASESRHQERRLGGRTPFHQLVNLTPFDGPDDSDGSEPISVLTKNWSAHGFGFFHHELIPNRYGRVILPESSDQEVCFVVKLAWCRFLAPNWYESGGEFVKIASIRGSQQADIFPMKRAI